MAQRSDVQVINLNTPVQFGEQTIKVLEVRKPEASDLRDMPVANQTMGHYMDLAAQLAGHPSTVINKLEFDDFQRVMEVVGNFMSPGQKGGKKK